jgi:hypothetical protein
MIAYHKADLFYLAGIWKDVKINPFFKRIDNRVSEHTASALRYVRGERGLCL